MQNSPLKVATLNVNIGPSLRDISEEYEVIHMELPEEETELKAFIIEHQPEIIISTSESMLSLTKIMTEFERPTFFLAVEEDTKEFPKIVESGLVDDFILLPVRRLDLINKFRWHYRLRSFREAEGMSHGVHSMIHQIQEDLVLAQKVQRNLIKEKFPAMDGLQIKSKYWCGLRSGGDYFDVFEYSDQRHVGFLLCDCSSYRLSSAFITSLMHLSSTLEDGEIKNPKRAVEQIYNDINAEMREKDELSIFYGVLDRKTYVMRYVCHGAITVAVQKAKNNWDTIAAGDMSALGHSSAKDVMSQTIEKIVLEPADRLLLASSGMRKSIPMPIVSFVDEKKETDPQLLINEFGFAIKKSMNADPEDEMPMPPQDCSILLVDVAKNILRLANG